jgi:uroporphyrinogen-III decarboxylase
MEERIMLTIRENFMETIKGGNPDRFVNQYEYMELIIDPMLYDTSGLVDEGSERVNAWGVTNIFPVGAPGPFPLHDEEKTVLKDITLWKEQLKAPDPTIYPEEQWADAIAQANAVDRKERFVAPFFMTGIFEKLHYLMGMEETMINFYEEPEAMHDLIDFLADWEIQAAKVIIDHYHPDALFHHDDWGSQISTFVAPAMFDEFILPAYKKIYGYWKQNGAEVIIHHSDSYAATLVPFMIEMGIDVWQGAVEENNIPEVLKKYGGQISIQCGLDNGKYDTPNWSKEKIHDGLDKLFKTAGTKYLIPSLTMGGPGSTYPGVYETAAEYIDEFSKVYFK